MKSLYVSNNSLSLQGIYKTKNFSIIILLTMKKTYLVLLACMLSTVAYADNKQTVKIDGNVIDKVVTEITFEGDDVVLNYADNTSETKDMSLVAFSFTYGGTTGINHVEKTTKTWNGKVYNLNGQLVGTSVELLSKGVYVINGQKLIVK